jgi:hypothetical protein
MTAVFEIASFYIIKHSANTPPPTFPSIAEGAIPGSFFFLTVWNHPIGTYPLSAISSILTLKMTAPWKFVTIFLYNEI